MSSPADVSSDATRGLADAIVGAHRDALDADNPIQGTIAGTANWSTMRVPVNIDGVTSNQPFSNDYTPNLNELVWLRGPAGAKIVTDRVGGRADMKVVNAKQQTVNGDSVVSGNAGVSGAQTVSGNQAVGGTQYVSGWMFVDGEAHAYRVVVETQVQADTVGCNVLGVGTVNATYLNGRHYGDSNGTHYGDQRGTTFGNCNGTHYGDQRGTVYGTCFGDVSGNDVGCNHIGCGVGNFGDLSYVRLVPPPSERGLKDEDSTIEGAYALRFVQALEYVRYRLREHLVVGGSVGTSSTPAGPPPLQAGIYVDVIAAWAPELIIEHANADGATGYRTYDDRGLAAYYGAAIAHQSVETNELRQQLADLAARVDQIDERTAA